jgi:hypothetical protein
MDQITLTLLAQEAVDVANIIGQLPTQSNAYPLYTKIKTQIEAQAKAAAPVATEEPSV